MSPSSTSLGLGLALRQYHNLVGYGLLPTVPAVGAMELTETRGLRVMAFGLGHRIRETGLIP
jgi:hypothetical protein